MYYCSGLFETPMMSGLPEKAYQALVDYLFPKRLGHPKEFAKLVLSIFENNMLNGEVIRLDGSLRCLRNNYKFKLNILIIS